jgi:hypothetical protein
MTLAEKSQKLKWLRENGFREASYQLWREIETERARASGPCSH